MLYLVCRIAACIISETVKLLLIGKLFILQTFPNWCRLKMREKLASYTVFKFSSVLPPSSHGAEPSIHSLGCRLPAPICGCWFIWCKYKVRLHSNFSIHERQLYSDFYENIFVYIFYYFFTKIKYIQRSIVDFLSTISIFDNGHAYDLYVIIMTCIHICHDDVNLTMLRDLINKRNNYL